MGGDGLNEQSTGLTGPIVKEEAKDDGDDEELSKKEATEFRAIAARANYLAQDRPDIQYTAKEICRDMSNTKVGSWKKLKRLARYLVEHPRLVWTFPDIEEDELKYIDAFTDSDWAGCLATRKSTSGGALMVCRSTTRTWASTQGTTALSSGEAEYYALVKAAAEALGLQSLAADLGVHLKVRIWIDSSAAKSMASRVGLGRVRHLEVRCLWVQETVKRGRIELGKIKGTFNPADMMTKPKVAKDLMDQMHRLGGDIDVREKSMRKLTAPNLKGAYERV